MVPAKTTKAVAHSGSESPQARAAAARAPEAPGAIPALVWETLWAHARTSALETAVTVGLFDRLVDRSRTAAEIARATKCSRRGVRMLSDTLVALGFLSKTDERYDLTETARRYLVSSSPASVGGLVLLSATFRRPFDQLTEAVRRGGPAAAKGNEEAGPTVFPELVSALFPSSFAISSKVREALPARVRSRVKRVLDVAAGSAAWSLAWAVADPEVRVTALDFPEVLEVTRQYTDGFDCTDRYEFREGSLRAATFGTDGYDLVVLGQICHAEGARGARKLVEKSARSLVPGGLLLVADMLVNDARTGPANNLLFALNMLAGTEDGDVFSVAECREWMHASGLCELKKLQRAGDGLDVIVATKRSPRSS